MHVCTQFMFCGFRPSVTVNQTTQRGTRVIEQQQKGLQCTEIKQVTVSHHSHRAPGDCRQQLCVKVCFSRNSCQQMKFGTIHRANVLHSMDSETVRESADIHISVNSSAKVVFLLLPKVFMILLAHVMHCTGRGWHQEIFIALFSLLLCPRGIVS